MRSFWSLSFPAGRLDLQGADGSRDIRRSTSTFRRPIAPMHLTAGSPVRMTHHSSSPYLGDISTLPDRRRTSECAGEGLAEHANRAVCGRWLRTATLWIHASAAGRQLPVAGEHGHGDAAVAAYNPAGLIPQDLQFSPGIRRTAIHRALLHDPQGAARVRTPPRLPTRPASNCLVTSSPPPRARRHRTRRVTSGRRRAPPQDRGNLPARVRLLVGDSWLARGGGGTFEQ